MTRLLTIFVTLLTLAHSTLGCCVHHAHAAEAGDAGHERVAAQASACHHHDLADGLAIEAMCLTCQRQHSHDDSHKCHEGHCNFARTEGKGGAASHDDGLAWQPLRAVTVDARAIDYLRSLERNDLGLAACCLPGTSLRTHLALSILLL